MSIGGNAARLDALRRDLFQRWHQTRESWRDAKAAEFDERFIRELNSGVESAVRAIDQLESALAKIRKDCE